MKKRGKNKIKCCLFARFFAALAILGVILGLVAVGAFVMPAFIVIPAQAGICGVNCVGLLTDSGQPRLSVASGMTDTAATAPVVGGSNSVELYFFYDQNCPYCQNFLKQSAAIQAQYPNLRLRSFEVTQSEVNGWFFSAMGQAYGYKEMSVPAFFIDKGYLSGYNDSVKATLEREIERCSARACLNPGSLVNQSSTLAMAETKEPAPSIFPQVMLYGGIIFGLAILWLAFKKFLTG